jgi:hypothetical protein
LQEFLQEIEPPGKDEAPNIKIEVNRREFGSKYEVKSYLGIFMRAYAHVTQ